MIITIDGPAGSGKSTVAKRVAEELGFTYFDTGAMYRALTWGIISQNVDPRDAAQLEAFLQNNPISVTTRYLDKRYFLGKEDVSDKIRRKDVTAKVSEIASIPRVRQELVVIQKKMAAGVNVVFEGRDMGTVVFPEAPLKIFLLATPEVRAERRYKELKAKHPESPVTLETVLSEINERDHKDSTRDVSPLKPAPDAVIIDTSNLTIDDVVNRIVVLKEQVAP